MTTQPQDLGGDDGVATVHLGADLEVARALMMARQVSSLAVVDPEGHAVGVITMTDLLRASRLHGIEQGRAALHLPHQPVERQMHRGMITVESTADLVSAARLMIEHRVHRVFVLGQGRPTGVVSITQLAKALYERRVRVPVGRYATRELRTVSATSPVGDAIDQLTDATVRCLVVESDGWPVGLFTQREALQARAVRAEVAVEESMSFALTCVPEETPMWRAAGHAHASRARRVLVVDAHHRVSGIVSGLDFATAYVAAMTA